MAAQKRADSERSIKMTDVIKKEKAKAKVPKKKVKVEPGKASISTDPDAPRADTFKGYDLAALGIPEEARPLDGGDYKGRHSYTVNIEGAAARKTTLIKFLATFIDGEGGRK